jgi:hypothetical protein
MTVLYNYDSQPAIVHEVRGSYISLSTPRQDILQSLPASLKPYERKQRIREHVADTVDVIPEYGEEKYETGDGRIGTRQVQIGKREEITPVYTERKEAIAAPSEFGSPITVGTQVGITGLGRVIKGRLDSLSPDFFVVSGIMYFWATQYVGVTRVEQLSPIVRQSYAN